MPALARRELLLALASGLCDCRIRPRRETILSKLLTETVAPDLLAVETCSRDLLWAAERLVSSPTTGEVNSLRASWRRAAIAWKRASAFRAGPIVETHALVRGCYWPTRVTPIRELVESERALVAGTLTELGADAKGLYALEYLLFGEEASAERITDAGATRRRELIRLYAEDLLALGGSAVRALRANESEFVKHFAASSSQSIATTVNFMAESVENLLAARFRLALWLSSLDRLRVSDIEGGRSRTSHELAATLLVATSRLYAGPAGIGKLVRDAAPEVHARVESLFEGAIDKLRALPSLEDAAKTRRPALERAFSALNALEVGLKSELPSALGVTLSFTAVDAD